MNTSWVGKTLGKVRMESLIARGGMAEVYLGTHITLQRKVAVKILRNPGDEHSESLERFQREARAIASLRHPNIVQVHDFDRIDTDPYLVMEYVQGPSLSAYLHFLHKTGKKLPLPHVVRMLGSVANALQYAHNNKIVHRDIKPGNILLTSPTEKIELGKPLPDDFEPVLTDFGLIRFLDSARQTSTGVTAGTPAYMSPEQAQGKTTDERTDVYSLGIVLYEMLAGRVPFEGETTVGILLKHVNEPPAQVPGLSPYMQKILDRALAKKRGDRFQSPMEFARAFSAAVEINPSTMQMDVLVPSGPFTLRTDSLSNADKPNRSTWLRIAVAGATAFALGAILFISGIPSSVPETKTVTVIPIKSTTSPVITSSVTAVPVNLVTSLILHFRDENAIADQAFFEVNRVPAPPFGSNYEVWLFNARERISLGILSLDASGKGELVFTEEQGMNLIARYDQAEITLEPIEDNSPAPTMEVAFTFSLPPEGAIHVRNLLSSFPTTPDKTSLMQGLYAHILKINELAMKMDSAYSNGNESQTRQSAEAILNLIVGVQSPDFKDWDQDGFIANDGNGYGLELNGTNLGYFGGVYTEADNAVNSINATEPILTYGEKLKTSIQNLAQWTPQLQDLIIAILEAPANSDIKEQIVDAVILSDQLLNGVDLDNDGIIESILGESGATSAYSFAYSMADMPLESTGLVAGIGTGTPSEGLTEPTSNGGNSGDTISTQAPVHTPPGLERTKKPSHTPKPKNNNNK